MGWVGPLMRESGFTIDHEHNHRGQCWWEMRPAAAAAGLSAPGEVAGAKDVRLRPDWNATGTTLDRYVRSTDSDDKQR